MLRKKYIKHVRSLLLIASILPVVLRAQTKSATVGDSLNAYTEFLTACQYSSSLPLQLHLEVRNTTNFVTSEEDTANLQGQFFIDGQAAYVRFGEVEQFVSDTVALFVSHRLQRMLLYTHAQPVLDQLKAIKGMAVRDSNALEMAKKYSAQRSEEKGVVSILLQHRVLLPTGLPMEGIILQYNKESKQLLNVTTTKRMLIPVSEEDIPELKKEALLAGAFVSIPEKGTFLVKEQQSAYVYHSLHHLPNVVAPASMAERVKKNSDGGYNGVREYENYAIIMN